MAARQHDAIVEGEGREGEGVTRPTIKRRGVIAGAAALAAALIAKQASDPQSVAASYVINNHTATVFQALPAWDNTFPATLYGDGSLSGAWTIGTMGQAGGGQVGVYGLGSDGGGAGVAGRGGANANATGVAGYGTGNGVGVSGNGGPNSATGVIGFGGGSNGQGVAGIGAAPTGPGIVGVGGNFGATSNADGIQGFAAGTGVGVVGHGGGSNGTGLLGFGAGTTGQGVAGIGAAPNGPGLVGIGGNFGAGNNADGVQGFANGTGTGVFGQGGGTNGVGVKGQGGGSGTGVVGTSSGGYGIVGSTTAAGYSGLTAITGTPGVAALGATSTVATAYAAFFTGTTIVNGNFAVTGSKSAAVAHPDGTHRLLYCMESPEAWFEDFGEAQLVNGKANVTLDPDFAALVHTEDYQVFLTEYGSHHTLAVMQREATGFVVEAGQSGASGAVQSRTVVAGGSGGFGWRVVAKRKGNPGARLEKIQLPQIKAPDMAALLESAKPPTAPKVTARVLSPLPKPTEPPKTP